MKYGGYRIVAVMEGVTSAKLPFHAMLVEVTNDGEDTVYFTPNTGFNGGLATQGIPIAPKSTRTIPMMMLSFEATGNVTVVAYGK